MQLDTMTPDLVLDGMGSRLEHPAELAAWLPLRPYRSIAFPDLVWTHVRLVETVAPVPQRTRQPGTSDQRTMPVDGPMPARGAPWRV